MTLNYFWQYIAGFTVANFWPYPIRRRVTKASALEFALNDIFSLQYIFLSVSQWLYPLLLIKFDLFLVQMIIFMFYILLLST